MSSVEFLKSERGAKLLVLNGYIYHLRRTKDNFSFWRCKHRSPNTYCSARVKLEDEATVVSESGIHNHESHENEVKRMKFTESLKERVAKEKNTPVQRLYSNAVATHAQNIEDAACLPDFPNIEKRLYQARRATQPALPREIDGIVLPELYRKTKKGQDFLLIDEGMADDRFLVFCTTANLEKLCETNSIWLDGTFKIVPSLFNQLYTIHARYMGEMFPFAFALLQDKRKVTYSRLFHQLVLKASDAGLSFAPETCLLDFEKGAINALNEVFTDTNIKGCYFHFAQSIWRKVQKLGLVTAYRSDETTRRWIRRLATLPFVPARDLDAAWLLLQNDAPAGIATTKMHDYVVDTYADRDSSYEIDVWNHFDSGNDRTNNPVEGWHSKLNRRVSSSRLNIFSMISLLQEIQDENEGRMLMLQAGSARAKKQKTIYREINEKIRVAKENYLNGHISLENYIDQISYLTPLKH